MDIIEMYLHVVIGHFDTSELTKHEVTFCFRLCRIFSPSSRHRETLRCLETRILRDRENESDSTANAARAPRSADGAGGRPTNAAGGARVATAAYELRFDGASWDDAGGEDE